MVSRAVLANFFEEQWTQNHPQYPSGLSRALFPTIFLEIAVYTTLMMMDDDDDDDEDVDVEKEEESKSKLL